MEIDKELAPQDRTVTVATVLPTVPGPSPLTIKQPFQSEVLFAGTKDAEASLTIANIDSVSTLTTFYRHASLESLWVTIHPTLQAPAFPTTVGVCWVPANSPVTPTQITKTYGGQIFCIGGAINTLSPLIVKCPLEMMNPRVKDSIQYLDSPKLLISITAQPTAPPASTCIITVSGTLSMHSPLITDTST
uniref:Capsid protein n=1 Tax=Turnip yellow mosaic virus TaxID=12154 RepID=A0A068LJQ3_TYMV|nr:capsid protein [Turnip yellow mosaic virus]WBG54259.1 capsid protein [Turnip yellow mosaic virus]WBG54311.1 capsid protein [Turnip yellow mosaic virus]